MKEEKKIQVTIQLDPEFVDKVDDLAKRLKLKRSQMMRNLMESGYEDAVIMDSIGVFKAVQFGNRFMKKLTAQTAVMLHTYFPEIVLK